MDKLILFLVFIVMLFAFLANPAPVTIEIQDLILILLPLCLGVLALCSLNNYRIYFDENQLIVAIILYLSYLLISMLIGLLTGVPLLNSLRSLGPYLNFAPLLFLGALTTRTIRPNILAAIFVAIASLQAFYQLYLYFTYNLGDATTLDVLRSRITLIEPRTTLPIILSATILPTILLTQKRVSLKLFALMIISIGFFAGAATLTRSVIISIIIGWLTIFFLLLYKRSQSGSFSYYKSLKTISFYLAVIIIFTLLIAMIPKIQLLTQGVMARFYSHTSSLGSVDYTNGRLYDEWIPALKTWANSGIFSMIFGIGAGNVFTVASGEERTYIHNILIYCLVYGGFYGLFTCLFLYFILFKTLIARAMQSGQTIYLAFAALLVSLFTYAQLFAVHKGLAFNAMLFLIIGLALAHPVPQTLIKED